MHFRERNQEDGDAHKKGFNSDSKTKLQFQTQDKNFLRADSSFICQDQAASGPHPHLIGWLYLISGPQIPLADYILSEWFSVGIPVWH